MRVPLTALAVLLLVLATACGGDDDDDGGGDVTNIEDAETCDDVGSVFLNEMQTLLDALSEMDMNDLAGGEQPEALTDFDQNITEIGEKSEELECSDEQMAEYLQDNIDDLEADGPVAEMILEGLQQGIESGELFETPSQ